MNTTNPAPATNGLAITSLVTGISGIIVTLFGGAILIFLACFGPPLGLVSIITGFIALNQIKKQGTRGKWAAIIGILLGAILLLLILLSPLILTLLGPYIGDVFSSINSSLGY